MKLKFMLAKDINEIRTRFSKSDSSIVMTANGTNKFIQECLELLLLKCQIDLRQFWNVP